jgi:dTDP-glucose 4,6-dehydratase
MAILVTGATGFIGSHLARRLIEAGHTVYGLIRHVSRGELRALLKTVDKLRFVEGDLTEYHSVRSSLSSCSPEAVVHLGALTPVRHSFENPFPYVSINLEGTMNVAHAILEASPRTKLVAASSAEVYGWQPRAPIPEDAELKPSSPYAVSKAAADAYLRMAAKVYGLRVTLLRCNNTYGRANESGYLVEYVISSMLRGGPVYVGAPTHVRDYMHVDDHVAAYQLALEKDTTGEAFNVSPGNPESNLEIAKKIGSLIGYNGNIIDGSYPPGYPIRPAEWDTDYIVLNSRKIGTRLGWAPRVSLEEGLKRTVALWRQIERPP